MKRICFLLNNAFIFDNRVKREAESLVQAGYEVVLLAEKDPQQIAPDFEVQNGVQIHRIFRSHLPSYNPFKFLHLKILFQILFSFKRFDFIHAHDANTLLLGWALSRLHCAKLIYDSHELWSSVFDIRRQQLYDLLKLRANKETSQVVFKTKIASGLKMRISIHKSRKHPVLRDIRRLDRMEKLEKWLISRCDAALSVNESLCRLISESVDGQVKYVSSIRNIPPYYKLPGAKSRLFHEKFGLSPETNVILYQGALADSRGIPILFDMMRNYLHDQNIALVLMGPAGKKYASHLQHEIKNCATLSQCVFYKEPVFGEEFLLWTASADLGIFAVPNHRLTYYLCLPNKIFEYVQGEIPLAVSNFPEMEKIVERYDIGFTFNPEDPAEIAKKIQSHFSNQEQIALYQKNIAVAKQELCWENEEKKLVNLYRLLNSKGKQHASSRN